VSVTVNPVLINRAPVALDDSLTIAEDSGTHVVDVLANDSDPDGDALTIITVTQGAHARCSSRAAT